MILALLAGLATTARGQSRQRKSTTGKAAQSVSQPEFPAEGDIKLLFTQA